MLSKSFLHFRSKSSLFSRNLIRNFSTDISKIRNMGIVAHIDAGKTTTSENMLYISGITNSTGRVDKGDTVLDFMSQERERGITISSAAVSLPWKGFNVNLIDTPGHVDFSMEVESSARILDGAVLLIDAVSGVQAQTRAVWKRISKRGLPAISFINKMDRVGADISKAIRSLEEELSVNSALLQVPYLTTSEEFEGLVDLISMNLFLWPNNNNTSSTRPNDPLIFNMEDIKNGNVSDFPFDLNKCTNYHKDLYNQSIMKRNELLDVISLYDENFMELCLEKGYDDISINEIVPVIRRLTISRDIVPVLCGASLKGKGISQLLDSIISFLPSPNEGQKAILIPSSDLTQRSLVNLDLDNFLSNNLLEKENDSNEMVEKNTEIEKDKIILNSKSKDLSALVFKVVNDPLKGPIAYTRIFSGEITKTSSIFNSSAQRMERNLSFLSRPIGSQLTPIESAGPGSVVCLGGLRYTMSGDTLLDSNSNFKTYKLEGMDIPRPVFALSLETGNSEEEKAMRTALASLILEDPSLQVEIDPETNQIILRGLGELHLEVIVERLKREFKLEGVTIGKTYISYKQGLNFPSFSFNNDNNSIEVDELEPNYEEKLNSSNPSTSPIFNFFLNSTNKLLISSSPQLMNYNLKSFDELKDFSNNLKAPIFTRANYNKVLDNKKFFAMFDIEIWPKNLINYVSEANLLINKKDKKKSLSSLHKELQTNFENENDIIDCTYEIDRDLKNLLTTTAYKSLESGLKSSLQRGFNNFPLTNFHIVVKPVFNPNLIDKNNLKSDDYKHLINFYNNYNEKFLNFDKNLEGINLEEINYKNMTNGAVRACIATFMSNLLRDKRLIYFKEPIMSVEIESPESFIGLILNDLNSKKRATNIIIKDENNGVTTKSSTQIIQCDIPLSNLLGYSNNLRSLTQGNANFSSTFSHFQNVEAEYIQF